MSTQPLESVSQIVGKPAIAKNIALGRLVPGKNPRRHRPEEAKNNLRRGIAAAGRIIQSITVRRCQDRDDFYEVVAGFGRYEFGLEILGPDYEAPCNLMELDDDEAHLVATIENVNRNDTSPSTEVEAAKRMLGLTKGDREEARLRLGWSRSKLDTRLALAYCSDEVLEALEFEKITLGHAELLAAVPKEKQNTALKNMLKAPTLPTVAQVKTTIEKMAKPLSSVIFDVQGCLGCPSNSAQQSAMFTEAIGGSNCTNGPCYDKKIADALDAKAEALKAEYPAVRILRPGENFTVLKIVATGPQGVGNDQEQACRGCNNFGAGVSALPDALGVVYPGLCFDPACHKEKVAAQAKAVKAAQQPKSGGSPKAQQSASGNDGGGNAKQGGKSAGAATAAAPKVGEVSQRVKDHRVKVWRETLKTHLLKDSRNPVVLLSVCLMGLSRHINATSMKAAFQDVAGDKADDLSFAGVADKVAALPREKITSLVRSLVASVASDIEEGKLKEILKWLGVDLAQYWQIDSEFLGLLTKAEIDALAAEIGLKATLGDKFAKIIAAKKDEMIKQLLATEGFEFSGKIPAVMQF